MKKILLIIMLLSAAGFSHAKVPTINLPDPPTVDILREDDEIDFPVVIANIKKAIKDASGDEDLQYLYSILALACDHAGDYVCELKALQKGIEIMPDDYDDKQVLYGNLGRAYFLNDMWEEGKPWYDKADAIDPDNYYNRVNVFNYYVVHKKDFKAAAMELEKMQELRPESDAYYDMYENIKNNEIAGIDDMIAVFKASIELDPDNYRAYRLLGAAYRDMPREDSAETEQYVFDNLNKALELNPDYIPTYITLIGQYTVLGLIKEDASYYDQAEDLIERSSQIDPGHLSLAYISGVYYAHAKQYSKAIEKLEQALTGGLSGGGTTPYLSACYNDWAYEYYQSGENLDKGLELVNKALDLHPDNGIILGTKAELLYKKGEYEQAHEYIKQAIALEPGHAEMQQDLKNIENALAQEKK